jgi:heat-inducible transcriptional repressor
MKPRHKKPEDVLEIDRIRKILAAVVHEYVRSAEPVGSRTLARRHGFDLSPATIRNAMADLEEMGYLSQPHTSAGRVPTCKAFRYYVDSILNVKRLTWSERNRIRQSYHPSRLNMTQTLRETCRILSTASNYLGLVIAPKVSDMRFKHIQFVRLGPFQVLAIFVTTTGVIQNKPLEMDEDLDQDYLDKMTRYLGTLLSGLTLVEVKNRILEEIQREKTAYDKLMERALKLGERALADTEDRELFMEGTARILKVPEFGNVEKMKHLLEALEEKSFLLKLLDQSFQAPGVQLVIGTEFDHQEMEDCTLVTASYGSPQSPQGTVGIIGPVRMNYSRVIPLVNYTAELLTENFAESG